MITLCEKNEDVDKYISGEFKVRNFVSRAEDGVFSSPTDAFDSMRLDYDGTEFTRGGSYARIEYTSRECANAYIPYSPELGGTTVLEPPFTGNGFTKPTNGHLVPEYFQAAEIDSFRTATMYLNVNGQEIKIAEWVNGKWIRVYKGDIKL